MLSGRGSYLKNSIDHPDVIDKDDDYYCANSIQFYFTKDEQKCSDIFINIFHL